MLKFYCYIETFLTVVHLSIVSTRVRRAGNPQEIYRLLLPEGRTFDENIFFQGGKIEHPRTDLTLFFKQMLSRFHYVIMRKLVKVADSAKIINFLSL